MKKYRVNSSEHFNLLSMYEHLKVLEIKLREDEKIGMSADELYSRIEKVESLMDKAYCVGALVDWPTLKRNSSRKADDKVSEQPCSWKQ